MVKLLSLLAVVLLSASTLFSQPYGNEWIDYSETHYKIKVSEDGIYKLSRSVLEANGYPLPIIGNELALYHNGELVPIYTSQNGIWNSDDYLYFYGERNDGSFDAELYEDPDWHYNPNYSFFTDTAVYFLRKQSGNPSSHYSLVENSLNQSLPAPESYYMSKETLVIGENASTSTQYYNGIGGRAMVHSHSHHYIDTTFFSSDTVTYYSPNFSQGEGLVGYTITNPPQTPNGNFRNITMHFPNFKAPTGESTTIDFTIVGLSNVYSDTIPQDHHFMAVFKDQNYIDFYFDGNEIHDQNITISDPLLPMNQTESLKISVDGPVIDRVGLFDIHYTYPREYVLPSLPNLRLEFSIDVNAVDGNYVEFTDADPLLEYILLDKTGGRIFFLEEPSTGILKIYIPPSSHSSLDLVLVEKTSSSTYQSIDNIDEIDFVDYSISQGNYVFITHPKFLASPNYVNYYSQFRSTPEGGNHSPIIVDIEQLYDQFSFGINKNPLSIKNFMKMARGTWTLSPEHLLLIGKGYRYSSSRYNSTLFENNLVPVWGAAQSDRYFTSEGFLPTGSIPTGRLSVRTQEELEQYIFKVISYSNYEPSEEWRKNVLHIEGGGNAVQKDFFNRELDEMATEIEGTHFDANTSRFPIPSLGSDYVTLDEMFSDEGSAIVTYLGHAASFVWYEDIGEVSEYDMDGKYPFMISLSNFNGQIYDNTLVTPMPESYVLESENGAIGFLGFPNFAALGSVSELGLELYRQIGTEMYGETIGDRKSVV